MVKWFGTSISAPRWDGRFASKGEIAVAIVAVSIAPVGGEASVSRFVAEALRVLEDYPQIEVQPGPMFTILEGDLDEIFVAIRGMQEAVFDAGAVRVSTVMKIDDRRDRELTMKGKMDSVGRHMNR